MLLSLTDFIVAVNARFARADKFIDTTPTKNMLIETEATNFAVWATKTAEFDAWVDSLPGATSW